MYNLIECIDNYSEISGILWQFKRVVSLASNDSNPDNVTKNNSTSFTSFYDFIWFSFYKDFLKN